MSRPSWTTFVALFSIPYALASLWISRGPGNVAEFAPWLAAGWLSIGCAVATRRAAPWSREPALLLGIGLAWLLPDFTSCLNVEPLSHRCVALGVPAPAAGAFAWLWLGIAGHAIATFPSGRLDRSSVVPAMAAFALALGAGAGLEPLPYAMALLVIVVPFYRRFSSHNSDSADVFAPLIGAVAIATAALLPSRPPIALDLAIVVLSISILAGLRTVARRRSPLTADTAVGLGPILADVLGDPTFSIAIRAVSGDGWLAGSGREGALLAASGATTTPIVREGREVARVAHERTTLMDAQIRAAVLTAVELEAHNVRLRASLAEQADELSASRRRLVDAALHEQRALSERVDAQVESRLEMIEREVAALSSEEPAGVTAAHLRRAADAIAAARSEVKDLSTGVYPPALASLGLVGVVRELASRLPMDISVSEGQVERAGRDAEATLYFVCAEALANAARHGQAASVRIAVSRSHDDLKVEIADDGVGGADPSRGTGIRGLRDRLEALGGTLTIDSQVGGGTRLVATVPVDHETH